MKKDDKNNQQEKTENFWLIAGCIAGAFALGIVLGMFFAHPFLCM